jgi:hypothetical protein
MKKAKVYHKKSSAAARAKYTEDFKSDKKDKKSKKDKKNKEDSKPKSKKMKKAKVYHKKSSAAARAKYTEDFTNSENKIYIMLPKSSLNNSIDIWLPNF